MKGRTWRSLQAFLVYALTFVPFFFVYFETAFFFAVFFVARPSAPPTSAAINGNGMAQHRQEDGGTLNAFPVRTIYEAWTS
jgi:hypothetical protein